MIVIAVIITVGIVLIWFLYLMGHPGPREPRFIYNLRRHPSAVTEYIAYLGYGLFQPRLLRTGATHLEKKCELSGDAQVSHSQLQETRATTIKRPTNQLWPWIVQIGSGRGGYTWWTPCEAFPEYTHYVIKTYEILPQFQQPLSP